VAALLVLSDGTTDYLSLSGVSPSYWPLNLNTLLTLEALEYAVARKRSAFNFSAGPDLAKTRWTPSSSIATYQDFVVVNDAVTSRMYYGIYSHVGLFRHNRRERQRHGIRPVN
jgi:Acetyltransferase (GNAT) domain